MVSAWNLLALPIFGFLAYLYGKNFYYAIKAVNTKNKSIITAFRFIGIFIPVWGMIMGLIKEPEYTNI